MSDDVDNVAKIIVLPDSEGDDDSMSSLFRAWKALKRENKATRLKFFEDEVLPNLTDYIIKHTQYHYAMTLVVEGHTCRADIYPSTGRIHCHDDAAGFSRTIHGNWVSLYNFIKKRLA